MVLNLYNITKIYEHNKKILSENLLALENISIMFESNKLYIIKGEKNSGKTTLLSIIGLSVPYTDGTYLIDNFDIIKSNDSQLAKLRKNNFGFIFSESFLDDNLSIMENIMLPVEINKEKKKEKREFICELMDKFRLKSLSQKKVKNLSQYEQYKITIARALSNNPSIILVDEMPEVLSYDEQNEIVKIFKKIANNRKCVILVSNNADICKYADVVITLNKGKIYEVK